MNRRFALLAPVLLGALMMTTAAAPRKPVRVAPPPPLGDVVRVAITTSAGVIEVELDHKRAPLTVENFMRYVDSRRYDGASFYRSMHLNWPEQPAGLVQAGVRVADKLLPPVAHEPTSQTGILHRTGTLSLARFTPGTGRSDFSILLCDMPGLDAAPADENPDRQAGFAAFGHVVSGMDVVRAIWDSPRSPTLGLGIMKGQMLAPEVRIVSMRRVAVPAAAPVAPVAAAQSGS